MSINSSKLNFKPLSRDLQTTSLSYSSTFFAYSFTSDEAIDVPIKSIILENISRKFLYLKIDSLQDFRTEYILSQAAN